MSDDIKSYKDLTVWQKSMELTSMIYELTNQLPSTEKYALASQLQRAAVSIPSNIAEGAERSSTADYIRFLYIAKGSTAEVETQLLIAERQYPKIDTQKAQQLLTEIHKMLTAIIRKLENNG